MNFRKIIPRKVITTLGFINVYHRLWNHTPKKNEFLKDSAGNYLPWMTYPIIEFLMSLDFADATVFEFGSGSSTFFWSKKAKSVYSVERDHAWYERVRPALPGNCNLAHQGNEYHYAAEISKTGKMFDVIVIDGAVRYPCLIESLPRLTSDGIILLDNLEWYPNIARKLRELGFTQIDFSGLSPQNAFTSCTSLFFKTPTRLQKRLEQQAWRPVGGRYLVAHDDVPMEGIDKNLIVENG